MTISNQDASAQNEEKLSYLQKVWRYRRNLVIEPFYFFYFMASVLNIIAILNFPLDKACSVNLGYSREVCSTTLDKSAYQIDCDAFNFENVTDYSATEAEKVATHKSPGFDVTVCKAEVGAQKLAANVSGKRAPIAAIFPIIVLLFAGGWSDRYNKRKACMIFPVLGESLMFLCLLISAIFFDKIPMEFGAYTEAIVPGLLGGSTLCLMAIDSYITISTPEPDRVFRFGIFATFTNTLGFVGQPISGVLFNYLGYTWSFAMAFSFNIIGMLYIIFNIKELKQLPSKSDNIDGAAGKSISGTDNPAYEITQLEDLPTAQRHNNGIDTVDAAVATTTQPQKRNALRDFFDPTLVVDYVKFPLKKRPNRGRMLLIFLMMAYFFTMGPGIGEGDFWNRFAFKKLNWNGNDYSVYSTVTSALSLAGTFIGTAIFSKMLKLSDAMVGIVSACTTALSRALFAFSNDTATFYAGGVADSFLSMRIIPIKAIGSSIVDDEELSKMFAIFSIFQPLSQLIFVPIYSAIYESTVDSFPGTIFLFSEVFAILSIIVFIICYFVVRRRKSQMKADEAAKAENGHKNAGNGNNTSTTTAIQNGDSEITSL
ncbi:solute carrier family 46 member 2 isoform X1 [Musca autumnalis]|uniref:solute carrier family 46 member 2 isoform X1 n=1 Tax=Musca autumnalis TaxID=221902 RepID=UPI003CF888E1